VAALPRSPSACSTPDGDQLRSEIVGFFELYDRYWSELSLDAVLRLWDHDDSEPTYIGDEYQEPILTMRALRSHYGRLGSRLQLAAVRTELRSYRSLSSDVVAAVCLCRWSFQGIEMTEPLTGSCWLTTILRRTPIGWRLMHYMEAPIYLAEF
jgi:hypothetical protein